MFVNIKKQGDIVGRFLDSLGVKSGKCFISKKYKDYYYLQLIQSVFCVCNFTGVLHGGRSQDQREDTLDKFRKGDVKVLVATDVAGRGLDIPDVTHVFNYDCPSKIVSYCHRIGRTGRAGKFGVAISFITDDDTEIMYTLKEYLESTNAAIPQQLARHPAAQAPLGSRDEKGNVVGQKRDSVKYTRI